MLPQHQLEFLHAWLLALLDALNVQKPFPGRQYIHTEVDKHLTWETDTVHIVAN